MFNNYAIVQGVDHIIPVDIYLPGCPPRPQMLLNAIIELHDQIQHRAARRQPRGRGPRRRGGRAVGDADPPDEGAARMSDRGLEHAGTLGASPPPTGRASREVVGVGTACSAPSLGGDTSGYGGLAKSILAGGPPSGPTAATSTMSSTTSSAPSSAVPPRSRRPSRRSSSTAAR